MKQNILIYNDMDSEVTLRLKVNRLQICNRFIRRNCLQLFYNRSQHPF